MICYGKRATPRLPASTCIITVGQAAGSPPSLPGVGSISDQFSVGLTLRMNGSLLSRHLGHNLYTGDRDL